MAFKYKRAIQYFLLKDFIGGFRLGMKYFFRPKATRMARNVVLLVNYARRFALLRRLLLKRNHVMMAAAAQRDMIST